jgi:nucleotide-binding universal stress UspA family protein
MRVLVAIDNSELSEVALTAIAPWARASNAEVLLLTVQPPLQIHETVSVGFGHSLTPQGTVSGQQLHVTEPVPVAAEDRGQALERARVDLEAALRDEAARFLPGVRTEVHIAWSKDVPQAIADKATELHADFIAIGTHGRKGISHALLGSVAEAVLRASQVPVLFVREGMRAPTGT